MAFEQYNDQFSEIIYQTGSQGIRIHGVDLINFNDI